MRVLMSTDTVGGVWHYALQLIRALAPHGVHVTLATMGAPLSDDQRAEAQTIGNAEVISSAYRLEWMPEPWEDVARAGRWLLEIADAYCPDVVHLNHYAHAHLPFHAPALVVGHSCVLSWFRAVKGSIDGESWQRYERTVRTALRHADLVVAPTAAFGRSLDELYGPLRRQRVIHNGRTLAKSTSSRREPIIFSAGRIWDDAKNVKGLAELAPKLEWPVHLASIPHPDGGQTWLENVTLLGHLSGIQMMDAYRRAGVYASPARYEPFGLTVLEAALHGCPLVLSDIPTFRELWHGAALFLPVDDQSAWRRTLNQLAKDETQRAKLGMAARERATRFSAERMAQDYFAAYQQLRQRFAAPSIHSVSAKAV